MTESYDKDLNILRAKRAIKMKEKAFFIIFKRLSINQITQTFLEGEGPTLALLKFFGNEMHSVKTAANYRGISNQIFLDIVKEI